ncbi:hypothetical protein [Qipengyuania zhejiangensis]|uniref:hypothetical protein n=1 Tax=Qipengyuania zhejiangensis TaxID=3077782 RepID=UPI002D7857CA|nr:hypothetical protein [Qipengyuania sp. Z2]
MSAFEILAIAGVLAALGVLVHVATVTEKTGSHALAAMLAGGFGGFTAITVFREGVMPVWLNHTQNLWGVQVWWDLLISVGIALFFVVPRARSAGMNVIPWIIFVALTASIGLLAMVARLFWLEKHTTA